MLWRGPLAVALVVAVAGLSGMVLRRAIVRLSDS
jgi:hypothetical protein